MTTLTPRRSQPYSPPAGMTREQHLNWLHSTLRDVKAQMRRTIHTTGTSCYKIIDRLEAQIKQAEAAS